MFASFKVSMLILVAALAITTGCGKKHHEQGKKHTKHAKHEKKGKMHNKNEKKTSKKHRNMEYK